MSDATSSALMPCLFNTSFRREPGFRINSVVRTSWWDFPNARSSMCENGAWPMS
jgi:hypothetical protein